MEFDNGRVPVSFVESKNEVIVTKNNTIKQLAKGVLLGIAGEILASFIDKATGQKRNNIAGQGSGHRKRRRNKRND